ncbi:hypothetical protein GALMADRAFT_144749 [Galerina marginata CBS 339.88]|uniref:Hydrophobin n=1 Tax=Galerina marginata (strain CBS 339.88) TaxID=685588 RepID=A0A067SHS1_GALM3|nr:hypothetical protein GALMADRAFT_144749 [Galerina marginata CBS 339.88]
MSLRLLQLFILSVSAYSAAQQCNTGVLQCCNSVQPVCLPLIIDVDVVEILGTHQAGNPIFSTLFPLVGIPLGVVSPTTPCGSDRLHTLHSAPFIMLKFSCVLFGYQSWWACCYRVYNKVPAS